MQISMKHKVILLIYKKPNSARSVSSPNILVNYLIGYVAPEWLFVLNHVNDVL